MAIDALHIERQHMVNVLLPSADPRAAVEVVVVRGQPVAESCRLGLGDAGDHDVARRLVCRTSATPTA